MEQHDIGTKEDLVSYRLESAKECLESAKLLMEAGHLKAANNRGYYAILQAVNAVHAVHGDAYKRHKDAIANFNKEYVKTEVFPRTMGRRIAQAEEIRHESDYDDFYIASKAEAEEQIATAEEFISMVEDYCKREC
ncbi:MAG: HEPN domain-containing protein [Lachnospiraceae bacterium]|nr:HEPN domain-containing protein [Lachnospiraceae bacterium]